MKHKHDSNGCDLKLENLTQVIFNFEVLTPAEQERVPKTAYNLTKQLLPNGQQPSVPSNLVAGNDQPNDGSKN